MAWTSDKMRTVASTPLTGKDSATRTDMVRTATMGKGVALGKGDRLSP